MINFLKNYWRRLLIGIGGSLSVILLTLLVVTSINQVMRDWEILHQTPSVENKSKFDASLGMAKELVGAIGTIATITGGVFLFLNYRIANENTKIANKNVEVAESRLITERFSKAVELLGTDKDHLEIRLGGIYSLEQIAKDSSIYHWIVMEVLTSFIQDKSPLTQEDPSQANNNNNNNQLIGKDIQAALTVIGRRNDSKDLEQILELSEVNLYKADLYKAKLYKANLYKVNLTKAKLRKAQLKEANLKKTNLEEAELEDANLQDATLIQANLQKAILIGANLEKAHFTDSNLAGAYLERAILTETDFSRANLSGCELPNTNLTTAKLDRVKFSRANLSTVELSNVSLIRANFAQANLSDANLLKAGLEEANFTRANLKNANLQKAKLYQAKLYQANLKNANLYDAVNLTYKQIKSACYWEQAIYTKADWNEEQRKWVVTDKQANQAKIAEIRHDTASDPQEPPDCSRWEVI